MKHRSIAAKYSQVDELSFWNSLFERGLYDYERRAVERYATILGKCLVVGCGCGREALSLAEKGHTVVGIDLVSAMVRESQKNFRACPMKASFVQADASQGLPFQGEFQTITLFEQVYQHVSSRDDRVLLLSRLRRHLAKDGFLFLSFYNEGNVNLVKRFQFLQATGWRFAKSVALQGRDPIMERYFSGGDDRSAEVPSFFDWLKTLTWVLRYFFFLFRRKARIMHSGPECKNLRQTNPCCQSEGSFDFPVLGFDAIESELIESGFEIHDLFVPLDPSNKLSIMQKKGSPLILEHFNFLSLRYYLKKIPQSLRG